MEHIALYNYNRFVDTSWLLKQLILYFKLNHYIFSHVDLV